MDSLVSIIIPTYNRIETLLETLLSIINQKYTNWEVIVVDDGSEDDTEKYFEKNLDRRINFIKRKDGAKGANRCRNLGLSFAKGEFVIFLDSDDKILPLCLKGRIAEFKKHHEADFLVFPGVVEKHDNNLYYWNIPCKNIDLQRFFYLDSPWQTTGAIWKRKSLLCKNLFWDEHLLLWQDIDFHIQALLNGFQYRVFWEMPFDYVVNAESFDSISRKNYHALEKANARFFFLKKYIAQLKEHKGISPLWIRGILAYVFKDLVSRRQWTIALAVVNESYKANIISRRWMYLLKLNVLTQKFSFNRIKVVKLPYALSSKLQSIPVKIEREANSIIRK